MATNQKKSSNSSGQKLAQIVAAKTHNKIKSSAVWAIALVCVVCIGVGFVFGYLTHDWLDPSVPLNNTGSNPDIIVDGGLSIHFLEQGTKYTGDIVYIKYGDTDILIDSGGAEIVSSNSNPAPTIKAYLDNYCDDGILEYVIATHAHADHILGFAGTSNSDGIFDYYADSIGTVIDFPKTNSTTATYNRYLQKRQKLEDNGTEHYTALECWNAGTKTSGARREWYLDDDVWFEILYNKYYVDSNVDENAYCVCIMLHYKNDQFLFTGDLQNYNTTSNTAEDDFITYYETHGGAWPL